MTKKRRKIYTFKEDVVELQGLGYRVKDLSHTGHYRIWEPEFHLMVDVWPSTKRAWGVDHWKPSWIYHDLVKEVVQYFYKRLSDRNDKIYWPDSYGVIHNRSIVK